MTLASTPRDASMATVVRRTLRSWLLPLGIFFGAIIVWDLLTRVLGLPQFILPAPSKIAEAWVTYLPELWSSATYTLVEILLGMAIGGLAGLAAGIGIARWASLRESILPVAIGISAIPIIAFAPLFNNWFGLDKQLSKAMVAAALVFFPVMINTARGLMHVEPAAIELMRSMAASDGQVFRELRSHCAMPFVFTALKVGTTLATIGAIIGEYFGAPSISLGQYIVRYAAFLDLERSWAAIVFASAIGISLYLVVAIVERLVMPWHSSYRTATEAS
ncbi:MAG TPA: ABC transporter permease [Candidatus Limnocylindrales bacterium]